MFIGVILAGFSAVGQAPDSGPQPTIQSASSNWQRVSIAAPERPRADPAILTSTVYRPTRTSATNPDGYRPAFTGDFATNRNGWKAGTEHDYQYTIGNGTYDIKKLNVYTQQAAFSFVELPANIDLNQSSQFTIKVDVVADSGRVPTGGIVFGVKDSLNYNAFTTNQAGEVVIVRVVNGQPLSDYMSAIPVKAGVPLDKNRNRLSIRRNRGALRFYVNEQEIRSSPYEFRLLSGNGIGVTSSGYWTSFQKLSVTTGL
ncbi:hypothetical protein HU175_21960 [Spirosoma sp. KUDC1026]|nr:hypothetical protein HU175_21960 [Spirosoma sp. KUDC1026]